MQVERALITGAGGFIGRALVERLVQEGARVRAIVRQKPELPFPRNAEIVLGDVTDTECVASAVRNCDLVVHCAAMQKGDGRLDDFRRVNVSGTLNLLQAAHRARVKQFIHISTINVHGYPPPPAANAESPLCFNGDFYSISKAEGERAAWEFARDKGFPLTVIRPACTYGPRSEAWTLQPLRRVKRGAPILIGKGDGICNAVYIDNLVDLIVLAATHEAALGKAIIGAEGRGVPWREFYGAYAKMIGVTRLRSMPRALALAAATCFEATARVTGRMPRLSRSSIEFYSHRVVFDISKSHTLLGYAPQIDFAEGMRRTQAWLEDNGILSSDCGNE